MYKCQVCQRVVSAGTKAYRIPVEFRFRRYPARSKVNRVVRHHKVEHTDDPGGEGQEIVREITVCPECAEQIGSKRDGA